MAKNEFTPNKGGSYVDDAKKKESASNSLGLTGSSKLSDETKINSINSATSSATPDTGKLDELFDELYDVTVNTKEELDNYQYIIDDKDSKINELEEINWVIENYLSKLATSRDNTENLIDSIKAYIDNNPVIHRSSENAILERTYNFYITILNQLKTVMSNIDYMTISKIDITDYQNEIRSLEEKSDKLKEASETILEMKSMFANAISSDEKLDALLNSAEAIVDSVSDNNKTKAPLFDPNKILITNAERLSYKTNTLPLYIYSDIDAKYVLLKTSGLKSTINYINDILDGKQFSYELFDEKYNKLTSRKLLDIKNKITESGYYDGDLFYLHPSLGYMNLYAKSIPGRLEALNDLSREIYKEISLESVSDLVTDLNNEIDKSKKKLNSDTLALSESESDKQMSDRIYSLLSSQLSLSEMTVYENDLKYYLYKSMENIMITAITDVSEGDLLKIMDIVGGVNEASLLISLKTMLKERINNYFTGLDLSNKELFIETYLSEIFDKNELVLSELKILYQKYLSLNISQLKIPGSTLSFSNKIEYITKFAEIKEVDYPQNYGEYNIILIDRVIATNPNTSTNARLKFVRIPYNTDDVNRSIMEADDNDFIDFNSFVAQDKMWDAKESDIINYEFNYINTKYYSIDVMLKNSRAFSNFAYMFNYLKTLNLSANYVDVLRFTEDEINGTDYIYLKDSMIMMSILVNRIMGVTYDRIMDDSDIEYIYELNNKDANSEIELSPADISSQLVLYTSASSYHRTKLFGDVRNLHVGDILNLQAPPSPNFSSTDRKITYKFFDINNISSSYVDIGADIGGGSVKPVKVKRKKFEIIDDLGRAEILNRIGLVSTDISTYFSQEGNYNLSLSYVESALLSHFNHKKIVEEYLNNTNNHSTYIQLYDYYKTIAFNKYSKQFYNLNSVTPPNSYIEYLEAQGYSQQLIDWLNGADVEGFDDMTLSEQKELYRNKLLRLINTIYNYLYGTKLSSYFANQNYLFYVRKIIKTVLDVFKSYTITTLSNKTEVVYDNYFDNHIKLIDEYMITTYREIGDNIRFTDISYHNVNFKLALPDYSTPPNAVVVGGDFVVNNGNFVVNNSLGD